MSVIKCIGLSKSYDGNVIFRNVSFELVEGDILAVLGPSGCGKTTLLKILGLLLRHTNGKLYLMGQDTSGMNEAKLSDLRKKFIGYSFQEPIFIPPLNVLDNVLLPLIPWLGLDDLKKYRGIALDLLHRLGLEGLENRKPSDLSTGQRKRVDLARALIKNPLVLIVDEPTANLDEESSEIIRRILIETSSMGKVVISSFHKDRKLVSRANKRLNIKEYK